MSFLAKGFLKAAHRPSELYCRVDPIPYLGLAFTLFVIFAVTAPYPSRHGIGLDLFKSTHARPMPAALREDSLRIYITRDDNFFFRNRKIAPDDLPNAIRDATLNGAEKKIYLTVDSRAHYGDINLVIQKIRLAGIEKVCFLTD